MPRKPIGERPMTDAERQARCRAARESGTPAVRVGRQSAREADRDSEDRAGAGEDHEIAVGDGEPDLPENLAEGNLALVLHAQAGDLMVGAQARDDDRGEHHDAHGQRQGCLAGLVELAGLAVVRPQEDVVGQDDRQHRAHGLKQVPEAQQGRALLSSEAKCNTPADLISARLVKTLRSVAMRSYSHLSEDERDQIGILRAAGQSMGAIARALCRAKTTISRELQRNALPTGRYSPLHAAGAYQLRRRREALLERETDLRIFVRDRLAEGWTPEQISGWLKSGNEPRLRAIGCETIYAFIYRTAQKAEALWRYLTRRHKRRRPRRARPSRDTIKDRASIHDRPKAIESRGEAGHWEGDLIICKCTRPVLVLHERKSRVTLAARLTGKTAAETISAMLAVFGRIDPHLRKSITFDNNSAFAQHGLLRTMRDMTTWFCDAYASWQKGGIENANGRLRRWLPRHLDIDRTSDQDIQEIVLTTNLTPRKCLGFKTPFQALLAELGKERPNPLLLARCASLRNPGLVVVGRKLGHERGVGDLVEADHQP